MVFYRTESGNPAALLDRCPHRLLPLSKGTLKGDTIECGYHGLSFDCSGSCVRAPGQLRKPTQQFPQDITEQFISAFDEDKAILEAIQQSESDPQVDARVSRARDSGRGTKSGRITT